MDTCDCFAAHTKNGKKVDKKYNGDSQHCFDVALHLDDKMHVGVRNKSILYVFLSSMYVQHHSACINMHISEISHQNWLLSMSWLHNVEEDAGLLHIFSMISYFFETPTCSNLAYDPQSKTVWLSHNVT